MTPRRTRERFTISAVTAFFLVALSTASIPPLQAQKIFADPLTPAYPLKASANNRYLVDQNNKPFLMVGDSPQNLITNLSPDEAALYIANRQRYGVNALWVNLLCIFTDPSCNKEAKTVDGIAPFSTAGDLATPNSRYFERAEDILKLAGRHGMVVLLNPAETISWLDVLRNNGEPKAFAYGQYLGARFNRIPNIIWMYGNDFQSYRNARDTALVQAVALGIMDVDKSHIHTVQLNYRTSGSLDDPRWAPLIDLDAAYTYYPAYGQVLAEYNRRDFKPIFMVEGSYEFEELFSVGGGLPSHLRRQEYWTMLSGATGQLYGSAYTWRLNKGWESNLDTAGVVQLRYMRDFFVARRWYDLVPDQTHEVMIAGYDAFACLVGRGVTSIGHNRLLGERVLYRLRNYSVIASNTCAAAARTSDGLLVIAYMPSIRTITIDMSKLASTTAARWYDPTLGQYVNVNGSPFANTGSRRFTPPGHNSSGEGDWLLVLEARATL
jgi:hypothetical protein